jgi:DNA (cytosine-5)-methyltransferase 1
MVMNGIDLFAGAGGFSEGAAMAGINVLWAANHWPEAVEIHAKNHPTTAHLCQDLRQADWGAVPTHDVLLASPACQGHSLARGKERPHHDAMRATAWAVVDCAEHHRAPVVLVENVPEFAKWILFPAWCDAMHRLGYAVAPHIVDSADHGVPQHRERLFLVCTQSKHPLHLDLPRRPLVPIGNFIEWDQHTWKPIESPKRSCNTLARVAAGRAKFGERFVAPYYSSGSGKTGRSIDRPIGTITTNDRWAVINGDKMRMLRVSEAKAAMGFRSTYQLPDVHKDAMMMLGNAVVPTVASDLLAEIRKWG